MSIYIDKGMVIWVEIRVVRIGGRVEAAPR